MSLWTVWGDGVKPVGDELTYSEMKEMVDADTTGSLYGEEDDTGRVYEGPK